MRAYISVALSKAFSRIIHSYASALLKALPLSHTCKCYLEALFLTHISNPFKGDIQNHTCKSYLKALFLVHINNPFKGDIQNHTCKSYLEALFLEHISNPFKGNIQNHASAFLKVTSLWWYIRPLEGDFLESCM